MAIKFKEVIGRNGHSKQEQAHHLNGVATLDRLEPRSEAGKYVTEEEYWRDYYDHPYFNYEWNNGILEEVPVSDLKQYSSYDWFNDLVREFLEVNPIAKKAGLEFGVRLNLPHKTTIRKPDLFIVRNDNTLTLHDDDRTYRGICDLCIEALSDSSEDDIERDTVVKKGEYEIIGFHEYFILDPSGEHRAFYRRNAAGKYEEIDAGPEQIIRSEALPGFQFRIADLTRKPRLVDLVEDEVYRGFILPEYQAERQRAEQAEQRAKQEQLRAEQAEQRAAKLAARLRALGLSEDLE
ncbi:MAG: Uma2 family endonuclease [Caldilinea sp. CFX5]|nr:Uma2 family endonuclease [Caldilinea sp. CFX5]